MIDINNRTDESAVLLQRIITENLKDAGQEKLIDLTMKILRECDDFIESSRQTHDVSEISNSQKALKSKLQTFIVNYANEEKV